MSDSVRLRIAHADGMSAEIPLAPEAQEWIIGRSAECAVVLRSQRVSRRHARLVRVNGVFFIEDLCSTAGLTIDGVRVERMSALEPGMDVRLADCALELCEGAPSASQDAPPPPPAFQEPLKPAPEVGCTPRAESGLPPEAANLFHDICTFYDARTVQLLAEFRHDIVERLNLKEGVGRSDGAMRQKLTEGIWQALTEQGHRLPASLSKERFAQALMDELIDYGPIMPLLRRDDISEVMVNGPDCIFVEIRGKMYETGIRFCDEEQLLAVIRRIVEPIGRHVDEASPMVDARLPDGSRVNAVIRPLSLGGAALTIRKFRKDKLTVDDLVNFGSMTPAMGEFLREAVRTRQNIVVSGGTGSGKTTLLNVLSRFIPEGERVITIEDSAELQLQHRNLVRMEARPANVEGTGRVTIRDLVVNTLRMRPDRIIVGECRGAEALDMLQAMNTGHDGSLTTLHANSPREALTRLENMVLMAGFELPVSVIRQQIASAVQLIVQQTRLPDGSRKVVAISEVTGCEGDLIMLQDIFSFVRTGVDERRRVLGYHTGNGIIPDFVRRLDEVGDLRMPRGIFNPTAES